MDKNAKMKVTVTGQIATFIDKTDDEIIKQIIAKVPEVENYKSYITIVREGNLARITLKNDAPSWLAPKLGVAFLKR